MNLRKIFLSVSLFIFAFSFCFTAFKVEDLKEIKDYSSVELIIVGPISFLGGGILEFFIWTANLWFFLSILFFLKKEYLLSTFLGLIASLISASFIFWKHVLVAENGRTGDIYSLEPGFFLWLTSILLITVFSFYTMVKFKNS